MNSNPTDDEVAMAESVIRRRKQTLLARMREEDEKRYEGYLFWCSEGCGFVSRSHRCEQWSQLTFIPPEAVAAIRELP